MIKNIEKLQSLILKELNIILSRELGVKNQDLKLINIVEVHVTKDKSCAKIFYSLLINDDKDKNFFSNLLEKYSKEIRMILAKKINLRSVPQLIWEYDQAFDNSIKIEEVLKKLKNEN